LTDRHSSVFYLIYHVSDGIKLVLFTFSLNNQYKADSTYSLVPIYRSRGIHFIENWDYRKMPKLLNIHDHVALTTKRKIKYC